MDIEALVWFGEHRTEFLTKFMSIITYAGSEIAAIGIACLVYWCFNRKTGNRMLLTMLSSLLSNQLLKIVVVARRPWVRSARVKADPDAIKEATGYSFPSGHTANAAAAFGGLAYGEKVKLVLKVLAWLLVVLVAISRLYLGVHTPQDVLIGLAMSIVLVYVMGWVSDKLEKNPKLDVTICAIALTLAAVTLLVAIFRHFPGTAEEIKTNRADAFKLVGAVIGMMLGWLLERRTVGFDKPKNIGFAFMRLLVGLALVLALLKGTKSALNSLLGDFAGSVVRYFLTCFTAIYLWPLIFNKIEKRALSSGVKA
ncbi:MAG: phosphatase PAP2 family protein [Clostridia bacterium]|nr:phosphatase PAP2 family protein [Clostridia bacterium]